ncbi:hypothetical protein E3G68_005346 [Mycobacteroides abscessus]|uniref:hypothetical protein n=1 Tax=Mycobacteroides abscessus TaxID=36809 RepID=UPI001C65C2F3|nr:hypothetical protein [Mycobacteroides abscessus]
MTADSGVPRDVACDIDRGLVGQARGRLLLALADLATAQAMVAEGSHPRRAVATGAVAGLAAAIRDKDEFVSSMLNEYGEVAEGDQARFDERMADHREGIAEAAEGVIETLYGSLEAAAAGPQHNRTVEAVTLPEGPGEAMLPELVGFVDLAARWGWRLAGDNLGELQWTRGANRVVAKFAARSLRPRYAGLLNYTGDDAMGVQLGTAVWRGIGNGGDSADAASALRRWFTLPVRALTSPTQW